MQTWLLETAFICLTVSSSIYSFIYLIVLFENVSPTNSPIFRSDLYVVIPNKVVSTARSPIFHFNLNRASDRSRKKKANFAGFLGTKLLKNGQYHGNFQGKLARKAIGKKTADFVVISLEIDQFCADQTSIFNVFLTETQLYCFVTL